MTPTPTPLPPELMTDADCHVDDWGVLVLRVGFSFGGTPAIAVWQ